MTTKIPYDWAIIIITFRQLFRTCVSKYNLRPQKNVTHKITQNKLNGAPH